MIRKDIILNMTKMLILKLLLKRSWEYSEFILVLISAILIKEGRIYSRRCLCCTMLESSYVHGNKLGTDFNLCIFNIKYYRELLRQAIRNFVLEMRTKHLTYEDLIKRLDYDRNTKNEIRIKVEWQESI